MIRWNMRLNTVSAVAAVILAVASAAQAQYYVVTDLGTISGPLSNAKGLDDSGRVVGTSIVADSNFHAALWDGSVIDVGTVGIDTQSVAYAINNTGAVVGVSYNYGDLQPHAIMWQSGMLTSLGQFSPHDISDGGVIVGHRMVFNAERLWVEQACRWTTGSLADLPSLGGHSSQALAINAAGNVVGQSLRPNNLTIRACMWFNGAAVDLGTLSGATTAKSSASDLNNSGKIVGWSDTSGGPSHACLFQVNGSGQVTSRSDLGALNNSSSIALGINDAGTIVGASDYRGVVWQSGQLHDLNQLIPPLEGWTIVRATAINADGVIAADGMLLGFTHAVLLTPSDCRKGDVNADGDINGLDVQSMVEVLFDGGTAWETCAGDMDNSGSVTSDDIPLFVQCLLGGACG